MKKIILIALITIWFIATVGTGHLLYILFKSMTDFITIKDIIGCYFFPALIYGIIIVAFTLRR